LKKSISVWIPRLPTIRVIGSHDISLTTTFCSVGVTAVAILALLPDGNSPPSRASVGYQRFS